MKENCIFCKIINGDLPADKIYENETAIVILDISPINPGHLLVIPKNHCERLSGMDEKTAMELFKLVMVLENMMADDPNCSGVNILQNNGKAAGQVVDHVHFHLITRYEGDTFRFKYNKISISKERMLQIKKQYRDKLPRFKQDD